MTKEKLYRLVYTQDGIVHALIDCMDAFPGLSRKNVINIDRQHLREMRAYLNMTTPEDMVFSIERA